MNTSLMTRYQVGAASLMTLALAGCGSGSYRNDTPSISRVNDQNIEINDSTMAASFSVADRETAASNLQVTASSSNPALVPASTVVLAGMGDARSVQVTPLTDQSGTATITLLVTDAQGKQASTSFLVTVRDTRQAFNGVSRSVYATDANAATLDAGSTKFIFDNNEAADAYDDVIAAAP